MDIQWMSLEHVQIVLDSMNIWMAGAVIGSRMPACGGESV